MNSFKGKHGPLLIAEIGGNHEGDFEYAKKLTQLAIDCDVDYIKYQIYTGDSLVSSVENPQRNKHFKKFELTQQQHLEIAKMVTGAGIGYMASVWEEDVIEWIDEYMNIYKVGSGDLTAYPLLKKFSAIEKPIILSTGLSTEQEVIDAVHFIQEQNPIYNNKEYLALLQCTSMYPIENSDAHLNVMSKLKELTGLTIGYSDHTVGHKALQYSVTMGAEVLEFHFTDSRENKSFRDHKVSLTPDEVLLLKEEIHFINEIKGEHTKRPLKIEIDNNHVETFRRSVYPSRDIKSGEKLTKENITVLRPNTSIDARKYYDVLGKVTTVDLKKHQKIELNNLK